MTQKEMKQIVIPAQDTPGTLGKIATVLGKAGVNITGLSTYSTGGYAYITFTTDAVAKAETALKQGGYTWFVQDLIAVDLPNKPGELGKLCQFLGQEGINIQAVYGSAEGKSLFFAVSPFEKGKKALKESMAAVA